uniref:Putative secreted peptide n=1 Tax=Anopheles braziliensis TaxID=58242 RepID=A0A2M3ZR95_9DIPT
MQRLSATYGLFPWSYAQCQASEIEIGRRLGKSAKFDPSRNTGERGGVSVCTVIAPDQSLETSNHCNPS